MASIVITPENKDAVHFKITSFDKNSFECENQENDFPKKITYRKTSDGLIATMNEANHIIDNTGSLDMLHNELDRLL